MWLVGRMCVMAVLSMDLVIRKHYTNNQQDVDNKKSRSRFTCRLRSRWYHCYLQTAKRIQAGSRLHVGLAIRSRAGNEQLSVRLTRPGKISFVKFLLTFVAFYGNWPIVILHNGLKY